jgi:hypothetical protein
MPEITKNDPFGAAMRRIILNFEIYDVLEIGAFNGDGSTIVIADALNKKMETGKNVSLTSLEYDPSRFANLQKNSAHYSFVKPVNASSISKNSFSAWDFEKDVWNSPFNGLSYSKEKVRHWHASDIVLMKEIHSGYLEHERRPWDAVLIDGGEFAGYDEFLLVKDRAACLFLDDAFQAFKTNRVRQTLLKMPDWRLVWADQKIRHGAAIFVKKSLKRLSLFDKFKSLF